MSIEEFLAARLAEDEAEADNWHRFDCEMNTYVSGPCDCGVPERARAEYEAKRRIVEVHKMMPVRETPYGLYDGCCEQCTAWGEYGEPKADGSPRYCDTLLALASIYADHSDYDEAWE